MRKNGFQIHQEIHFRFALCAIWCEIYFNKDRLHIGFASKQEPLTGGARRLKGEFRIVEKVAGMRRSHAGAGCISAAPLVLGTGVAT